MIAPTKIRRSVVSGQALTDLQAWTSSVEAWPAGSHIWGHYAEQTPAGAAICRTENVSACHDGFRELVGGTLREVAASAMGVEVVDFKDKINYKQPGGAGFSPHQDLLAYPGANKVMSVLMAIDECTTTSGCLWLAAGVDERLPIDDRGVILGEVTAWLDWTPAELAPGDAVCVDGFAPHFSEANKSTAKRRVLVASYAPADEGYARDRYYTARRSEMERAVAADSQFRIGTLGDFEGTEARTEAAGAVDRCTHE